MTVSRTAGDADLSVSGGSSLSFTPSDWNTPQTVTLSAAEDADAVNGTATITVASAGLSSVDVTASEADNDTMANRAPIADAGGPYVIAEGQELALNASGSHDPDVGDMIMRYDWDLDGDGDFDDLSSADPVYVVTWPTLISLGIEDGPDVRSVSVRVSDILGEHDIATAELTLVNAAPSATVSAPTDGFQGVRGQIRSFTLEATDPSPVDEASSFSYTIDWGDGSPWDNVTGGSTAIANHVYQSAGAYTIVLTVADKDGLPSIAPVSLAVTIVAVELQGDKLAIGGTTANDSVVVTQGVDVVQ